MPLTANANSNAIAARTTGDTYDLYRRLSDAMRVRYNTRVSTLDPRIGAQYTMHLAHNWHRAGGSPNESSDVIVTTMARYERLSSWLSRRADVEHKIVEHRRHLRDREAGRYMWCPGCDAYNAEQKAIKQPRLLSAPLARKAAARP